MINNNKDNITNNINTYLILFIVFLIGFIVFLIGFIFIDLLFLIPLHFLVNRLIGFIEEIDGSNDKYLVAVSSLRNKKIINALDMLWSSIKDKINRGIKIKDYDKFRFNSDIDLPVNTIIEFRSLLINVSCVIEKDNEYYPEIYLDNGTYLKTSIY